ncbi:hypothetical protein D3C77_395730 [compost metagenome]
MLDLVVVLDIISIARGAVITTAYLPTTSGAVVGDHVVAIAVTEVDHFVDVFFRLVVEHCTARAGAAAVRVPVEVGIEAPVAVEAVLVLESVRGHI